MLQVFLRLAPFFVLMGFFTFASPPAAACPEVGCPCPSGPWTGLPCNGIKTKVKTDDGCIDEDCPTCCTLHAPDDVKNKMLIVQLPEEKLGIAPKPETRLATLYSPSCGNVSLPDRTGRHTYPGQIYIFPKPWGSPGTGVLAQSPRQSLPTMKLSAIPTQ